jgi:predicted nucleic acid-binding protein
VDIFFDTTVLVAASVQAHPHYPRARPALQRVVKAQDRGFICVHSMAEVYAALTRLPVRPRIHPLEALRILTDNILPHFETIAISKRDYIEALNTVGSGGYSGGKIYDALLLCSAAKNPVARLYTFNLVDFKQLASPELQGIICAP